MRQRVLKKILSAALLICLLVSYSDGPLRAVSGSRPPNQAQASCCEATPCCCDLPEDSSGCEVKGASADLGVGPESSSRRSACLLRSANCDPVTGVPQPTATKNLASPLPRAALSYTPFISETIQLPTPALSDPLKPSVYRPPRA